MNCPICRNGDTAPGKVTVTLQRGETTIVVKEVPAEVCQNCGEFYLSEEVTGKLLNRAEAAVKNGAELEILRYAA
jgi:YgiT-type zinc finger domain-containing protein